MTPEVLVDGMVWSLMSSKLGHFALSLCVFNLEKWPGLGRKFSDF